MTNVSVIVPAYNSEDKIGKCLKSLLSMSHSDYEVILVDDGSEDNTVEVAKNYDVEIIQQENSGPATARDTGVSESQGDYLFFTDSDCLVPENWIDAMLENFEDKIGIVGGGLNPYQTKTESEKFEQMRREELYGNKKKFIDFIPACNMAIRREVFDEISGFDEDYSFPSYEDYDLCKRVRDSGYKILYIPEISVTHYHSPDWSGVLKRAKLHGMEGVKFRKKHGESILKELITLGRLPLIFLKHLEKPQTTKWVIYDFNSYLGQIKGLWKYRYF